MITELAALAAFSLVSAASPGPNNVILWASGLQFGLRQTLPHVVGTSLGIGAMGAATAAGLGAVIATFPQVELALRVVGSIYLLYLAFQVAGSNAARRTDMARPLSWGQATAFQFVNPKAWVFVVAAFTTFRPEGLSVVAGGALMVLTMMIVVLPSALLWAAGGSALNRFFAARRAGLGIGAFLATLLAVTVVYLWI